MCVECVRGVWSVCGSVEWSDVCGCVECVSCQLWSPGSVGSIQKLEGVQRSFTNKIRGMERYSYWERLEVLDLYSLQRRRERYHIIYVWKMLNDMVPNFDDDCCKIRTVNRERRGKLCILPAINTRATAHVKTLKEESFAVCGPRLFNSIPEQLRSFDGELGTLKKKLDKFLKSVPDKPSLPHYYQAALGNSLPQQLSQQRVERG